MTTIEYMIKQVKKHQTSYDREAKRGVPEEQLKNIENKISYYEEAVEAIDAVSDRDFQTILTCALRYSLGRRSYMPALVVEYIKPLLPKLSDNTLTVMERDISTADDYGDETIDKPYWMRFLEVIHEEQAKRKKLI